MLHALHSRAQPPRAGWSRSGGCLREGVRARRAQGPCGGLLHDSERGVPAQKVAHQCDPLVKSLESPGELLLVDFAQQRTHARPGLNAQSEKVAAPDERTRRFVLHAERACALEEPANPAAVEIPAAPAAIRFRDAREELEVDFLR